MFAIVSMPFVWTAVFINWYNKRITLKTNTYTDGFNSEGVRQIKKELYYDVAYNKTHTAIGLAYTLLAFFIGLILIGLINKATNLGLETLIFNLKDWFAAGYFYVVGIAACFAITYLFFGVMALIRLIPESPKESDEEYRARRKIERQKDIERMERKRSNPSFFKIAWQWLVAFKEKNCPLITWDYNKKD